MYEQELAKELETETIALKGEINRQVRMKLTAEKCSSNALQHLGIAWNALLDAGMYSAVENMIWDYVNTNPVKPEINMLSSELGIFTVIKDYENKKGRKHKAHFTQGGIYLGPVSKLGDVPIGYKWHAPITQERFKIVLSKLKTMNEKGFPSIFELK